MNNLIPESARQLGLSAFETGELSRIDDDGKLVVQTLDGHTVPCLWLQNAEQGVVIQPGDQLLFIRTAEGQGVVLGRVGPYRAPELPRQLTIEATEVLTLRCGEVAIDLRAADGKMMLRGEDVLLRAKGMQRIKAGSVSIN